MTTDTETAEAAIFELPARLDTDTAPELRDDLIAQRGLNLTLNGAEVGHLGARCLAVLLSAALTWRDDEKTLELKDPSEALLLGLARMGTDVDAITVGEAA